MRFRRGDKIRGRGKHGHKKLTVLGHSQGAYEVKSNYGRENGRVHRLKIVTVDRFYEPRTR
jgi:hypothetical protein